MWESPVVEQYDEGISKDSTRVDIDGLEEARCVALVQSARYLEGVTPRFSVGFINPNEPVNCVDFDQTTVNLSHHLEDFTNNP
jgi:predicted lipoprotein